jgi:1-acyl-sn-glycerol-3-phosphate acyltransferase
MDKLWLFKFSRLLVLTVSKLYFRIEFEGVERIPSDGPMIIAPNHASYLDPLWVSIPIKRPMRYMTWDKMVSLPLLGTLMKAYGAFPVNVDVGDRGALRRSLEQLKTGGGLVIFPEGSRTRTGRLLPFKPGVIRLATETNAPILPVTIIGGYRAFSPHHLAPRPYKLKIIYHEPIKPTPPADHPDLKQFLRDEACRLQAIVSAPLPEDELPENEGKGH